MITRHVIILPILALAFIISSTLADPDWEHDFNKRSLLYVRSPSGGQRSRSSLPWGYRNEDAVVAAASVPDVSSSPESFEHTSSSESVVPSVSSSSVESNEDISATSSSGSSESSLPGPLPLVPIKGESAEIVHKKNQQQQSNSEEEDEERDGSNVSPQNDLITFSYYPITQKVTTTGNVVYEIQDTSLRTARGGKKKGKKGCKKGKGKKKGKKKGKGKKGKKGCGHKGGWWYVWDKKHGYLAGRWGDPPPKGLEREHYWHNFGKHGHGYGAGYDGHGHMGWKKHGWGGGHGGHGGHHGGGGFGGYGGGGGHGGWGWQKPIEYYGWGWAEKQKGWGWRR